SRRRHTRSKRDWSSDVCSSDLASRRRRPSHQSTAGLKLRERTSTVIRESGPTTSGRANRECALIGTSSMAETSGQTTGPPPEKRSEERRVGRERRTGRQKATND